MRLDEIRIVPYDGQWPELFEQQRVRVAQALAPWLTGPVEHIGSTSIPGLAAKAIIDMLARVTSHTDVKVVALEAIGWVHAPEPGDDEQRKWSFCYPSVANRSHHLHIVEQSSKAWQTWLAFRDRLRDDPQLAAEYGRIKESLAAQDNRDRVAYLAGKAPFIETILQRL